ncbi:hypothetical protein [Marinobacterium aestuariivivens]|uniref:Uncharacterized protein n=1 Tax=Marinobacterium aestuariivivens TaxID=1698799 RepID=A0ABW2A0D3_9GAMM
MNQCIRDASVSGRSAEYCRAAALPWSKDSIASQRSTMWWREYKEAPALGMGRDLHMRLIEDPIWFISLFYKELSITYIANVIYRDENVTMIFPAARFHPHDRQALGPISICVIDNPVYIYV